MHTVIIGISSYVWNILPLQQEVQTAAPAGGEQTDTATAVSSTAQLACHATLQSVAHHATPQILP